MCPLPQFFEDNSLQMVHMSRRHIFGLLATPNLRRNLGEKLVHLARKDRVDVFVILGKAINVDLTSLYMA